MKFDFLNKIKPPKCVHCGHVKQYHKAGTFHCPTGQRHRVIGFTSYHLTQKFEEKPQKNQPEKNKAMPEKTAKTPTRLELPNGKTIEIELPPVPKSFNAFKRDWGYLYAKSELLNTPTYIPCHNPDCRGRGWIYDPNEQPCPIEGNKLRGRLKCPDCGGNGCGSKKKLQELHKLQHTKEAETRQAKLDQVEKAAKSLQKLRKTLTPEEWENLRALRIVS